MSSDNITRKGKIARLPRELRNQINEALLDGQTGPEVCDWLNALPAIRAVLKKHFKGEEINEQNLSAWRQGGFRDWCDEQARVDYIEAKAEMAVRLVEKSGMVLSDAAAVIAAGDLLAEIEAAETPEAKDRTIKQIVMLRSGDHAVHDGQRQDEKLKLDREKTDLKKEQHKLNRERFERLLIEKLIETAKQPEVQRILTSGKPKTVQMDLLHEMLFGKDPHASKEEAA